MPEEPLYLGRYQQGVELPLSLQCVDASDSPDDPQDVPVATIWLDGSTPALVETVELAAAERGVVTGFFRRPHFLGNSYSSAGRYLVVYKWLDSDGTGHAKEASFTLLPGGSDDGAVIAATPVERPDARYLLYQTDAGSLVRGRNPR